MNRVDTFLELTVKQGGSDLHLVAGHAPRVRINGVLHPIRFRELTAEDMRLALDEVIPAEHKERLARELSVDFAYSTESLGRFRINVYHHTHGLGAALRVIPATIPSLASLGLPDAIRLHAAEPNGLILVAGPTGSGKSTTLAAIVDHINQTRNGHIITLEDPIEYLHPFKKCIVTQREIRVHAPSLADALRDAVREDPDVILVGELRDPEAISIALTAAETGIQIFGTLHTSGAARTIDRIINTFPANRQEQARGMLADSLRMVVSQRLLRTADGSGRVAALEILVNTKAVKAHIRAGSSHKLASVIQTGAGVGMQSSDAALQSFVDQGVVSAAEAAEHANDRSLLESRLARAGTA
jgi:twitching motility protein PilT